MRGENHLLVLGVRRFFVNLVQRARDGFKHRGIRCFCHVCKGYGLRVMGYGTFFRVAFPLRLLAVLLYVVETQRDDFEDDVHKDLFPILFVFSLHRSKITKNDSKII